MSQSSFKLSGLSGLLDQHEFDKILEDIANNKYEQIASKSTNNENATMVPKLEFLPMSSTMEHNIVCNEDYPGDYNFEVFIDPHHGNKSPWVYSPVLTKVFITPYINFPIDFKWDHQDSMSFYIRATPVFANAQFAQDIVARCVPHTLAADISNKDISPNVVDHIMRCQSKYTIYDGDKNSNQRLSLVIPLFGPKRGSDMVRQMFQFVCKNSCPTGMNRRALEVVFTLEDQSGQVLGRKVINVRICSCPKRDREKEEKEYHSGGKNVAVPYGKRRKPEKKPASFTETDLREYECSVKVIGKHNARKVYWYAHDLMAGEARRNGNELPYNKVLIELTQKARGEI